MRSRAATGWLQTRFTNWPRLPRNLAYSLNEPLAGAPASPRLTGLRRSVTLPPAPSAAFLRRFPRRLWPSSGRLPVRQKAHPKRLRRVQVGQPTGFRRSAQRAIRPQPGRRFRHMPPRRRSGDQPISRPLPSTSGDWKHCSGMPTRRRRPCSNRSFGNTPRKRNCTSECGST